MGRKFLTFGPWCKIVNFFSISSAVMMAIVVG